MLLRATIPKFETVAPELIAFLRRSNNKSLVKQKLGTALRLDSDMIENLLSEGVRAVGLAQDQVGLGVIRVDGHGPPGGPDGQEEQVAVF